MSILDIRLPTPLSWAIVIALAGIVVSLAASVQWGFFIVVFAALAWWVWHEPEDGFLLLIFAAPILPMLKITHTIDNTSLIKDIIIFTLFFRTFLIPLARKTLPYRPNIAFAPLVALAGWSIVGALFANAPLLGALRLRDIGLYMMLYFGVLYLPHSKEIMKRRAVWFAASAAIVLGLAAYQWFFAVDSAVLRYDPVREIWIPRISSIMAHPSILGQYLVAVFSLAAAGIIALKSRTARIAATGTAGLCAYAVFLTYSRAAWLGLAVAAGIVGLVWLARMARERISRKMITLYASGAIVIALLALAGAIRFTPVGTFVRSAVDPTYGSNEERIVFASRLVAALDTSDVITGRGLGDVLAPNFRSVDLQASELAAGQASAVQETKSRTLVDNQHLKTLVELGVIGLGLYAWLYWRIGRQAWRQSMAGKPVGIWMLAFLAAFLVQGLFIDIWEIFPTNAMFWTIAALVSQSWRSEYA